MTAGNSACNSSPTNVHFIKPKTINRIYKRHKYTVTFIPSTKKWQWTVEVVQTLKFTDVADTQVKAFRAAEKLIDGSCKS